MFLMLRTLLMFAPFFFASEEVRVQLGMRFVYAVCFGVGYRRMDINSCTLSDYAGCSLLESREAKGLFPTFSLVGQWRIELT
jgi:hypothetical protein